MRPTSLLLGGAAFAFMAGLTAPASASLIADGITYTLVEQTTAIPTTDLFQLQITGINGALDTEGGRSGVQSFAFNPPTGFVSAAPPSGFTVQSGGLNSSGCNGHGNFFCFAATTTPPNSPALAANSSLSFAFSETVAVASDFTGYVPDFKINWVGNKNNYDLVSLPLAPTAGTITVPEPVSLAVLGSGLLVLGFCGNVWKRTKTGVQAS